MDDQVDFGRDSICLVVDSVSSDITWKKVEGANSAKFCLAEVPAHVVEADMQKREIHLVLRCPSVKNGSCRTNSP